MKPLRAPLRAWLSPPPDRKALGPLWGQIQLRRAQRARLRGRRLLALGASVCFIGIGVAIWASASMPAPRGVGQLNGPLRASTGTRSTLSAQWSGPRLVRLDDGSTVSLGVTGAIRVERNTGSEFDLVLDSGKATFAVTPRGPRRWSVTAATVRVEVVGTRFSVERLRDEVRVEVEHGIVRVSGSPGARDQHGPRQLIAGESLVVSLRVVPQTPDPISTLVPEPEIPHKPSLESFEAPTPVAESDWLELAREGRYEQAYARVSPRGVQAVAARTRDVDILLLLADVARLSGHPTEAVPALTKIVDAHSEDPQASLAAYALGRLYLDRLHDAPQAAQWLERAAALHPPVEIEEQARGHRVRALSESGQHAAATTAAYDYIARFPNGSYRVDVRRWGQLE